MEKADNQLINSKDIYLEDVFGVRNISLNR